MVAKPGVWRVKTAATSGSLGVPFEGAVVSACAPVAAPVASRS